MKKYLSKNKLIGGISLFLCFTMIGLGILSIYFNISLQGNARVINYTGIIRGGTQRLVKQELMHIPNDALIAELDENLSGLIYGDKTNDIIQIKEDNYQAILRKMEIEWLNIKDAILQYRNGGDADSLFELSEQYFILADEAVHVAEVYTENMVQHARKFMIIIISAFIIIIIVVTIFIYKHEKRKKKILAIEEKNKKRSEELAKQAQQLLMPINEMSELMYIADVNTYELLFVNDAGKKLFNIKEYKGQKCYKILQGFDRPCEFCTNAKLYNDQTYTWEYTNPIINRHYLLKDRLIDWENREVRMEIAFDITDSLKKKKELEKRIKRDNVLVTCIRELYQNHQTVDAMNHVLEFIGKLFDAKRSYIFYMENDEMSNIAEWCNEGVVPQINNLQHLSRDDYKWWFQLYDEQVNVVIQDIELLKGDRQAEYELLAAQEIKRLILVPFEQYENFGGMIGLDDLKIEEFDNAEKFLRTFSYFIMLSIRRNKDEKTLYQLSYLDTLTMFYNRNRYIQDIEELSKTDDAVGVIFVDLNGLKEINDNFGHDAGDELLKNCAQIIQNSLISGNFYRVGGDEFVVICVQVEKIDFKKRVQKLKEDLDYKSCKAAVGYQWVSTCNQLEKAIDEADQYMYADKEKFYSRNTTYRRYLYKNS